MSLRKRGRHVLANGIRLHYVEIGEAGPPLVVLPGITMPAETWAVVGVRLAELGHVYILDHRGRGLSERRPGMTYTLSDYARDTVEFCKALALDAPIILGHSMGARIAIRACAMAPRAAGPIVLVDPPVTGPGRRAYPAPLSVYLDGIALAARGEGVEAMRAQLGWPEDQLDLRMQWLPTCDPEAVAQSYRSFHDEDVHAYLPHVMQETLLVYAERGGTVTDEDATEIVGLLPLGRSVRIDGAGHMVPWDRPEAFYDALRDFLGAPHPDPHPASGERGS